MKHDIGFLIGRFQVPSLHKGHMILIQKALDRCTKLVVLLGSANRARSLKNPWTFKERKDMLHRQFIGSNIEVLPLNDYKYSGGWHRPFYYF